jgi:hypothetical protein
VNHRIVKPDSEAAREIALGRDDEEEREQPKNGLSNQPPRLGLNLTEAAGKVVAFLNIINDPPEWQGLEIRFTDGTLFHFEFQTAPLEIVADYMEARNGYLHSIREYGLLPTESERHAHRGE